MKNLSSELIELLVDDALERAKNKQLKKIAKELLSNGKKKWYLSKTFWLNALAFLAFLIQLKYGFVIGAEEQIAIVTVANLILRAVTKEELY